MHTFLKVQEIMAGRVESIYEQRCSDVMMTDREMTNDCRESELCEAPDLKVCGGLLMS